MQHFVDVILPLPLDKRFTYAILDSHLKHLTPGMRVAVPFGKTKVYTGIVAKIHTEQPQLYQAKYVEEILDEYALVTSEQLRFFKWIADYYLSGEGEVLRAALPSAFLLQSETVIELNPEESHTDKEFTDEEYLIYEALQRQSLLKIGEVMEILDKKKVLPVLNNLVDKKVILVNQELYRKYKPKRVRYVRMAAEYEEGKLNSLLEELSNAPKQREVVLNLFSIQAKTKKPIKPKALEKAANTSASVIKSLVDKGVLEEYYLKKDRINYEEEPTQFKLQLTPEQERALGAVKRSFAKKKPALLHGITGSGKTEIYIELIREALEKDQQVLYLLPEIALTTQLIMRLQSYFGAEVLVYHSKYSVNERVEVYKHILKNDKGRIIVGVRSSIFLPFSDLGLIVIDESHETTFKQFDPAPRYQARDAALVLAHIFKSDIVMGTATPSLESYFNTTQHKYDLVELKTRFGEIVPPQIELIDIKEKYKRKKMKGHFSDTLLEAIAQTLEEAKQVILFQNRRGFSPVLECRTCGHSPQCPNCDVSLTYYQHNNSLRCHYCGYRIAMQKQCMVCDSTDLTTKGFGTEQVEAELKEFFPEHVIGRMDLDTTRGKFAYEKIISSFEQREIDILVGTQMLAKGLDFRHVDLVGVMNADNLLNFPDFRAHERAFQLLVQVAGRAGRTDRQGKVLIQTYNPEHTTLRQVLESDYRSMYDDEMQGRRQFKYPPYYRLIRITFRGRNYGVVNDAADWTVKGLKAAFKENVLGPEFPPVARIRNEYYKIVLLKIPPQHSLKKTKEFILKIRKSYEAIATFRSVRMVLNVDPY